jgi:hypothetical protein
MRPPDREREKNKSCFDDFSFFLQEPDVLTQYTEKGGGGINTQHQINQFPPKSQFRSLGSCQSSFLSSLADGLRRKMREKEKRHKDSGAHTHAQTERRRRSKRNMKRVDFIYVESSTSFISVENAFIHPSNMHTTLSLSHAIYICCMYIICMVYIRDWSWR